MPKRPRVLHLALLAIVATVAGTWWLTSRDEAPLTTRPPSSDSLAGTPASAPPIEPPVVVPPRQDLPPMPPPDLPLRDALPSLQSRADAGDSLAACRLGVELLRCAALGSYPAGYDEELARQEAEQEAKGNPDEADRIAMGSALLSGLRDTCASVPDSLVTRAHHYVRQAALAGEPEAMVRYANGETITAGLMGMGFATRPGFDQWRREARPMLMRALEAGVPEAALVLAMAQARDAGLLAMLLPRDEVEASASLALTRELFGDISGIPRLASGPGHPATPVLDAERAAAAAKMAADWHARGYQGRRFVLANSTAALQPLHRMTGWQGPEDFPSSPRPGPCVTSDEATP